MKIDIPFEFGDIVYLKTDKEQHERIVSEIRVVPGQTLLLQLCKDSTCSDHYLFEVTKEKNVLKTLS